ncbi:Importin subunit beta-1 [Intoshia linei]|uniref:Importin subunit beta-1 n=1 Tax=Intoshia linei TaxID=1819745 RepID=A0A177B0S0_9BILA|nr:Importin subunit beta-1 [Intoshia linei]
MDLHNILEKTVATDKNDRESAQSALEQLACENLPTFFLECAKALRNVDYKHVVRSAAALQIKNSIYSKDEIVYKEYSNRWLDIPSEHRNIIKNEIVETLGTETWRPSSAAQVISVIAAVEFRKIQWYDLVDILFKKISFSSLHPSSTSDILEQAILDTIGYMCQDIQPTMIACYVQTILMCIDVGMKKMHSSTPVHLSAINCFLNVLEATAENFADENQRNHMMDWLFQSVNSPEVKVVVTALQCLVKICSLYYQYIGCYMASALFEITVTAIENTNDDISLQGIEFWSNICDVEADIVSDNQHFCLKSLDSLVPILIKKLIKKKDESDMDDDEWNPCKSAGVCIMLLTSAVGPPMVEKLFPFIRDNLLSDQWNLKDAAIYSLGSILEPSTLSVIKPIAEHALVPLTNNLSDPNKSVRDSCAWVIGRIFEILPSICMYPDVIKNVLSALVERLSDENASVANNACWAILSIAVASDNESKNMINDGSNATYPLSPFFNLTIEQLLNCIDRKDAITSHLQSSACECISGLIKSAAEDCYDAVTTTMVRIMNRLNQIMEAHQTGKISVETVSDMQTHLLSILQSGVTKIKKEQIQSACSQMMELVFRMFALQPITSNPSHEDAIILVDAILATLKEEFYPYMKQIHVHIMQSLNNPKEEYICITTVTLICGIVQYLKSKSLEFTDDYIRYMILILETDTLPKSLKPGILSCIGDIALCLNDDFTKYLNYVLPVLCKLCSYEPNHSSIVDIKSDHNYRDNTELVMKLTKRKEMREYLIKNETYPKFAIESVLRGADGAI